MGTVTDLITGSLRLIGRLGPGRTAGPSELQAAFLALNELIDEWGTERLMVYTIVRATYTLTGGQQTYTIGPAGTFNALRPVLIEEANIILGNVRLQMEIVNAAEYSNKILETTLTGQIPRILYDDMAAPLSTLYLWPIPSGTPTLELFTWQAQAGFVAVTDNVALPAGYEKALRYGLAVAFASEVGKVIPPQVAQIAGIAKTRIERVNRIVSEGSAKAADILALENAEITAPTPPA